MDFTGRVLVLHVTLIFVYLKLNLPGVSCAEQLKSCHFAMQCFQLLIEEMCRVDGFG